MNSGQPGSSAPARIWARILALFCILAVLKMALLAGTSKNLFEIHWRAEEQGLSRWDYALFGVLVCLGVLSLWRLATQCRLAGEKAVRTANATVVGLGLLFIFLTSYSRPYSQSYLYPILTGVLKWSSLGPYLGLDWFFQSPFLAAWVLSYAFLYYVMARTGRERWALYVTAVYAGAYGILCLRELAARREELMVVDCLGLVSLLIGSGRRGQLRLGWALVPAAWGLLFAAELLRFAPTEIRPAVIYFFSLLAGTVVLFGAATWVARSAGFGGGWNNVVAFYFTAFLLLANTNYPVAGNYSRLLCLGFEFPHYFGGEVLSATALAVAAIVYTRLWPKGRLWWLDVLAVTLIALTLVDVRLAQVMGVRFEWNVLALGNSPKMIWRMARPYSPGVIAALVVVAAVYGIAVKGMELRLRSRLGLRLRPGGERRSSSAPIWYATACFALLGLLGLVVARPDKAEGQAGVRLALTSPLWRRLANHPMSRDKFLQTAQALGLGDFKAAAPANPPLHSGGAGAPGARRDLNVVLVLMESSYNKYLSLFGGNEETQPLLSKYKERMELFPNFFSNFASSIHARFATFTSLYPVRDYNAFTLERVPVKSLFEALHDDGYTCSLFYSSFADFTGFRDFLKQRGLDELYDADNMPGPRTTERLAWGLQEEETLVAMRTRIKEYRQSGQRFFLTYVPAAPHYPYENVPKAFRKFQPGEKGDQTAFYLDQLLYMDWVLASMVDQLKESGLLEKTLVIITDDHGELLGANGGPIGHGWLLTPELANAPLIVMDPENPGYHVNQTTGSQIDLLPTVLDLLKIPAPAQLYEGRSLYARQPGERRLVYLNSYQQYGIIDSNRFVLGDREAEQKGSAKRSAYLISNDGSKTIFSGCGEASPSLPAIARFDQFQENLLRNYSFYCASVQKGRAEKLQAPNAKLEGSSKSQARFNEYSGTP